MPIGLRFGKLYNLSIQTLPHNNISQLKNHTYLLHTLHWNKIQKNTTYLLHTLHWNKIQKTHLLITYIFYKKNTLYILGYAKLQNTFIWNMFYSIQRTLNIMHIYKTFQISLKQYIQYIQHRNCYTGKNMNTTLYNHSKSHKQNTIHCTTLQKLHPSAKITTLHTTLWTLYTQIQFTKDNQLHIFQKYHT